MRVLKFEAACTLHSCVPTAVINLNTPPFTAPGLLLPGQWLQCQANGSNVRRVLRLCRAHTSRKPQPHPSGPFGLTHSCKGRTRDPSVESAGSPVYRGTSLIRNHAPQDPTVGLTCWVCLRTRRTLEPLAWHWSHWPGRLVNWGGKWKQPRPPAHCDARCWTSRGGSGPRSPTCPAFAPCTLVPPTSEDSAHVGAIGLALEPLAW